MSLKTSADILKRTQEANMLRNNHELRPEIGFTFNFQTSMRALFLAAALMALSAAACFAQGKVIPVGIAARRTTRLG